MPYQVSSLERHGETGDQQHAEHSRPELGHGGFRGVRVGGGGGGVGWWARRNDRTQG